MTKRISQVVWRGGDNIFRIRLSDRNVEGVISPVVLDIIDSMKIEIASASDRRHKTVASITVNKNDASPSIDWWDVSLDTGEVDFKLGPWVELDDIEDGDYTVRLISYDLGNQGGIYWSSHARRDLTINIAP